MGKVKKTKVILEIIGPQKKDLQHCASLSGDSIIKNINLVNKASSTNQKNINVEQVCSSLVLTHDGNSTDKCGATATSVDVSSVMQSGDAIKDTTRKTSKIIVKHKYK